jgi:hypothetical protein
MKLLNNLKLTDIRVKIINTKDVKIKIIQEILNKKSLPKCQDKWNNVYNEEFHWPKIWINLKIDWTPVIKLKNFNGHAPIALFIPKVDLEKLTHPMNPL